MKIDWVLLKRSVLSDISEEERNLLNAWLDESSEHREFYREIKTFLCSPESFRPTEERIRRFKASYEARLTVAERRKRRHRMVRIGGGVAASCILSVGMACFLWWQATSSIKEPLLTENRPTATILPGMNGAILTLADGSDILLEKELVGEIRQGGAMINIHGSIIDYRNDSANSGDQYNLLAVQKGGEYMLTLGDGTRVWMNADSRLKYPVCFNDTLREVFLEGEAYFEVAPDSSCPFLVETAQQQIKVLGTKFNVSAYLDEPTETTLLEGSVYLTGVVVKGEHQLVPGEQVVIDPVSNEFTVTEVDAENVIAWTLGKFVFDDNTLEQVMKKLERWYGVEVDYVDPEVKKIVFKGNLPRYSDLRILLGMIEKISPVRFQVDGYKITVSLF